MESRVLADLDIQQALLNWYAGSKRDLPWRRETSPYRTLVSEVMLQQTQVDRVVPTFESFVARFPTFAALASASRANVIRAWAGLGYNRRAVHLHETARIVVERFGGELPSERNALLGLPGIGPYTAGAILSIAFDQDEAALDTNVRRVIGRVRGLGKVSEIAGAAQQLVPHGRASAWNQALMDLGATICSNRSPRCLICPVQTGCQSAGQVQRPPPLASRQEPPFHETMRYYRGRLLEELRSLSDGETASIPELAKRLSISGVAEPPAGWEVVGRELARDGLVHVAEQPEPHFGLS